MLTDLAGDIAPLLDEAGFGDLAQQARAHGAREGAGAASVPEGRVLVCAVIDAGAADEGPVKDLVDGYLVNDSITKGFTLRPSRLAEISQG